jgi:Fe-S-cluster containining protein
VSHAPRSDATFLRDLDRRFGLAERRAAEHLACDPGCATCCIGPFPITRLDALRLADGLTALRREDPERAARVEDRARFTRDTLRDRFPGDASSGRLVDDGEVRDAFLAGHATAPCPALDPGTSTCDLYAWRPVTCRTYGPPTRIAGEDLPPCGLCFEDAPETWIERCRVEPDPDGREDALLGALPRGDDETLVAFALADVPADGDTPRA